MIGLGTIINSAAIVAGGLVGHFAGKLFRPDGVRADSWMAPQIKACPSIRASASIHVPLNRGKVCRSLISHVDFCISLPVSKLLQQKSLILWLHCTSHFGTQ